MSKSVVIPEEVVISKMYLIRNNKVMLDDDLNSTTWKQKD
jgi:hypothetical protein